MMKANARQRRILVTCLILAFLVLPALSFAAGDGVVVLQREVPPRPAYREAPPSRASIVDVSPDDKVQRMVNGQPMSSELQDDDFANVSSGQALGGGALTALHGTAILADTHAGSHGLRGLSSMSSPNPAQSTVPIVAGAVGPAVSAATGQVDSGMKSMSGVLNGLSGSILRTGAP